MRASARCYKDQGAILNERDAALAANLRQRPYGRQRAAEVVHRHRGACRRSECGAKCVRRDTEVSGNRIEYWCGARATRRFRHLSANKVRQEDVAAAHVHCFQSQSQGGAAVSRSNAADEAVSCREFQFELFDRRSHQRIMREMVPEREESR